MKELSARMVDVVEKRQNDLNRLLSRLIQARSENPPGDVSEAARVVGRFLEDEGIKYQTCEPIENHTSVIATVGTGKPSLIFCGHIDVVPAGDASKWSVDPYGGKVKKGKLYGRGASDQKGGVAAQLMALAVAKEFEKELAGKITVANVPDEEAQGPGGVLWLLNNKKLSGDTCVITEPTGYIDSNYSIVGGERGTCWLRITAHGKPAHGSTPALGRNAIGMLTEFLPKLKALETETVKTPKDAEKLVRNGESELRKTAKKQGVPVSSLTRTLTHYTTNLGVISGGTKTNVVPEKCEAEVDIRVPAGGHPDGVEEFVRGLLPEHFDCQVINKTMPSYTPADHSLVRAAQKSAQQVLGYVPAATYMAATSDAHFFRELLGVPTVAFGPGFGEACHTYDEYVYTEDVKKAAQVYAKITADITC